MHKSTFSAALLLLLPAIAMAQPSVRLSSAEQAIRRMPDELLAAELQRRGWIVAEP